LVVVQNCLAVVCALVKDSCLRQISNLVACCMGGIRVNLFFLGLESGNKRFKPQADFGGLPHRSLILLINRSSRILLLIKYDFYGCYSLVNIVCNKKTKVLSLNVYLLITFWLGQCCVQYVYVHTISFHKIYSVHQHAILDCMNLIYHG
jgi:hypothetical protein